MTQSKIHLKTLAEIETMAVGGKILAGIMDEVAKNARTGVSLEKLDRLAFRLIKKAGATPAFLGYRPEGTAKPYPATICASINEVVVHGVPNGRVLKQGEILKLDFGLSYEGLCVDAAVTVAIGEISPEAKKMVKATRDALYAAIQAARPGKKLGDIGYAI